MTTSAVTSGSALPPLPLPGATPREIRAALWPELREQFDRDYRAALDEASRTLDLAAVHQIGDDMTRRWRKPSRSNQETACVEIAHSLDRVRDSKNPYGRP